MSDDQVVELSIPADPAFFHVARSVVTAVAGQLDLPVDEIDDVRLAVAECCNMLAARPGLEHLKVRAAVERDALVIEVAGGRTATEADEAPTDSLSWSIVSSLADDIRWQTGEGTSSVITRWQMLGAVSP